MRARRPIRGACASPRSARLLYRALLLALLTLTACLVSPRAQADTCTASMTPITFPSVNPILGAAVAGQGTLTVSCEFSSLLAIGALVCVNLGPGANGQQDPRLMSNTGSAVRLQYRLSQNSNMTPVWGTVTAGQPIQLTFIRPLLGGQPPAQSVTIYGQVLPNQFTVPTVNNATTTYSEAFTGNATLNYLFYTVTLANCSGVPLVRTMPFTVSAPVTNNCTISTSQNMVFDGAGTRSLLTSPIDATATLAVRCTNNDAYRIRLDGGRYGTVAQRFMQRNGGTQRIPYALYTNSTRTTPWGDGTGGTNFFTATGTGNIQTVTVYGRVPAQAAPVPGTYSDTVTATIEF